MKRAPCPFCGSDKCQVVLASKRAWIKCDDCGARGPSVPALDPMQDAHALAMAYDDARAKWDRRAVEAKP